MRRARASSSLIPFVVVAAAAGCASAVAAPPAPARDAGAPAAAHAKVATLAPPVAVPIDEAGHGIGFDDLGYSKRLDRVIAPAGRTGRLALVEPATRAVTSFAGFTASREYGGGHGQGTTSADEGRGLLFAVDRGDRTLAVVDPARAGAPGGAIVARASLGGGPDYARYVAATGEVWVTEPSAERIEVFAVAASGTPTLTREAAIPVAGGPESLVVDATRGRAYAHLWKGRTVAIDLRQRAIVARWPNGCVGSRGIALDEARGLVFVGCDEGRATVLDVAHGGRIVSTLDEGRGIDVIAWDGARRHLYLPGEESATLGVLAVATDGRLTLVARAATASGAHCVAVDGQGGVWVCDPERGRLLRFQDDAPVAPSTAR